MNNRFDDSELSTAGLSGGAGADQLAGTTGADLVSGGGGADILAGDEGADIIYGNTGADIIYGNQADDYLFGGGDNDTLYGGQGADTLDGGAGDDHLFGGVTTDLFRYTGGDDIISDFSVGATSTLTALADDDKDKDKDGGDDGDSPSPDDIDNAIENGPDLILLAAAVIALDTTGADLAAMFTDDGNGNAVLTSAAGTLTLEGVAAADLTADHFLI